MRHAIYTQGYLSAYIVSIEIENIQPLFIFTRSIQDFFVMQCRRTAECALTPPPPPNYPKDITRRVNSEAKPFSGYYIRKAVHVLEDIRFSISDNLLSRSISIRHFYNVYSQVFQVLSLGRRKFCNWQA